MTLVQSKLSQTLSPSSVLTNLGRHLTKPDRESLYPEDNPALLPLIPNWYHPPPPFCLYASLSFHFFLLSPSYPFLPYYSSPWPGLFLASPSVFVRPYSPSFPFPSIFLQPLFFSRFLTRHITPLMRICGKRHGRERHLKTLLNSSGWM